MDTYLIIYELSKARLKMHRIILFLFVCLFACLFFYQSFVDSTNLTLSLHPAYQNTNVCTLGSCGNPEHTGHIWLQCSLVYTDTGLLLDHTLPLLFLLDGSHTLKTTQ